MLCILIEFFLLFPAFNFLILILQRYMAAKECATEQRREFYDRGWSTVTLIQILQAGKSMLTKSVLLLCTYIAKVICIISYGYVWLF